MRSSSLSLGFGLNFGSFFLEFGTTLPLACPRALAAVPAMPRMPGVSLESEEKVARLDPAIIDVVMLPVRREGAAFAPVRRFTTGGGPIVPCDFARIGDPMAAPPRLADANEAPPPAARGESVLLLPGDLRSDEADMAEGDGARLAPGLGGRTREAVPPAAAAPVKRSDGEGLGGRREVEAAGFGAPVLALAPTPRMCGAFGIFETERGVDPGRGDGGRYAPPARGDGGRYAPPARGDGALAGAAASPVREEGVARAAREPVGVAARPAVVGVGGLELERAPTPVLTLELAALPGAGLGRARGVLTAPARAADDGDEARPGVLRGVLYRLLAGLDPRDVAVDIAVLGVLTARPFAAAFGVLSGLSADFRRWLVFVEAFVPLATSQFDSSTPSSSPKPSAMELDDTGADDRMARSAGDLYDGDRNAARGELASKAASCLCLASRARGDANPVTPPPVTCGDDPESILW